MNTYKSYIIFVSVAIIRYNRIQISPFPKKILDSLKSSYVTIITEKLYQENVNKVGYNETLIMTSHFNFNFNQNCINMYFQYELKKHFLEKDFFFTIVNFVTHYKASKGIIFLQRIMDDN